MKLSYHIVIACFIFCYFVSCNDNSVNENPVNPENNFVYPFGINTFWYYGTRNFVNNFRPDSVSVYFSRDTINGFGGSTFLRDTVIGSDTLRIFRNNHSDPKHFHSTTEYYKQHDSGLYRHAYISESSNFSPVRPSDKKLTFEFNQKQYYSLKDIFGTLKLDADNDIYSNDTILKFDNPPLRTLKYPVNINSEWIFKNTADVRIHKKYIDYENVSIIGNNYYCIKLQKSWYFNNSPSPDENIIYFDYFSKEGMVKRKILIKDIKVFNANSEFIGYVDANEEAFLNIFSPN